MADRLFRKSAAPSVIWGEGLAGKFAVAPRAGNGPVFSSWPASLAKCSFGFRDHWAGIGRHLPSCSNGKFGARMGFPERLVSAVFEKNRRAGWFGFHVDFAVFAERNGRH